MIYLYAYKYAKLKIGKKWIIFYKIKINDFLINHKYGFYIYFSFSFSFSLSSLFLVLKLKFKTSSTS